MSLATIAVINSARIALERARVRRDTSLPGTPRQADRAVPVNDAHDLLAVSAVLCVVEVALTLYLRLVLA